MIRTFYSTQKKL